MAGGYKHAIHGWSMIETVGDAHETVEELLWLVQEQIGYKEACNLLDKKFYPMSRGDVEPDDIFEDVKKRMAR